MVGLTKFVLHSCVFLLLAACTSESQPPLRIGSNHWIGYQPVYLAREQGYLTGRLLDLMLDSALIDQPVDFRRANSQYLPGEE